jgi:V8-like Glu-specific endopeptidase
MNAQILKARKGLTRNVIAGLLSVSACSASAALNGDRVVGNEDPSRKPTAEEMQSARPFARSLTDSGLIDVRPLGADSSLGTTSSTLEARNAAAASPAPQAFGEFGVPYTSKRVSLDPPPKESGLNPNSPAYLSATFPYSAVGRLNFQEKGVWTHCSASLILRSVIVTAAHCIQDFGAGKRTFKNWTFVPAFFSRNDPDSTPITPYGSWEWQAYVVPKSWTDGSDTSSGDASNNDLAVIVLKKDEDKDRFVGDLTGWLRYGQTAGYFVKSARTGELTTAAITTLGYPGGSDDGKIMQRCDGPSYMTLLGETLQIYQGSDFTGGSSGGPWVANFGFREPVFSEGIDPGQASLSNVVVGVTSWGNGKPGPQFDNFSSQFGTNKEYPKDAYGSYGAGNIGAVLELLCSATPAGSDKTYAELGYCDRRRK